jgi:dCMP deaminase
VTAPASSRPSLAAYLMSIADTVATRSTCSRLSVGAVLVREGRILSAGYNGAPSGVAHCQHADEGPCRVAVHAEANAVAFAARHNGGAEGATMFVTHSPCGDCAGLLINAGITNVVYGTAYRSGAGVVRLAEAGVRVEAFRG